MTYMIINLYASCLYTNNIKFNFLNKHLIYVLECLCFDVFELFIFDLFGVFLLESFVVFLFESFFEVLLLFEVFFEVLLFERFFKVLFFEFLLERFVEGFLSNYVFLNYVF